MRNQRYMLTGQTSANAYRAEVGFVRLENRLDHSEVGWAVTQAIARLETISTVRVDGLDPDVRELTYADSVGTRMLGGSGGSGDVVEGAQTGRAPVRLHAATVDALRYMDTLRWIARMVHPGFVFTPDFILDVHSRCLYGVDASQSGARFRGTDFRGATGRGGVQKFCPPSAKDLPEYLEDLCRFMNAGQFSPMAQAGFMHFQFESIKPFRSALDRTGRALCHALFYARDLLHEAILPIALLPAIDTSLHAGFLLPYDHGEGFADNERPLAIDSWTNFCAVSSEVATSATVNYIDAFNHLENEWTNRVGKVSRGSATQEIMRLLPGCPFITVERACQLTGKSFSTVNDALARLCKAGVLLQSDVTGAGSRVFEARGVMDVVESINSKLLKTKPVSRASVG